LKDITNGRLRRYGDFPNQTFFGLIADEVKKKSEKQSVEQQTNGKRTNNKRTVRMLLRGFK
jgi:hypothetical protein